MAFSVIYFCLLLSVFGFAFGFIDHRGHYRHKFIGFIFQWQSFLRSYPALFAEQFQPKLRFISLLQRAAKLGHEFVLRPGAGRLFSL
jgi:hypothetical protein